MLADGVIIVDNYVDQLTDERRAKDSRYVALDEAKVGLVRVDARVALLRPMGKRRPTGAIDQLVALALC